MIKRNNRGKRYSETVIHNDTVYLSGMIAESSEGNIEEQSRETFDAIDAALASVNSNKSKLISMQCWISDFADFDGFNSAFDQWIDQCNLPVRATAQCALYDPRIKIEIVAIAAL